MTTKEEIEQTERDNDIFMHEDGRRKRCPTCGRDSSNFITHVTGKEECTGWFVECKCGELIDED